MHYLLSLCVAYCGNPLRSSTNDFSHRVIAYSDLPTSVYFSCPFDLVLTGPNTTTCVNKSHWEPDPSKVMCTKAEGVSFFTTSVHACLCTIAHQLIVTLFAL